MRTLIDQRTEWNRTEMQDFVVRHLLHCDKAFVSAKTAIFFLCRRAAEDEDVQEGTGRREEDARHI